MNKLITSTADFAQAIREERERQGLTHADIDHRVGWQDGYCSKVEAFDRRWGKSPFNMTINANDVLQSLGLGLVLLPIEQAASLSDAGTERRIKQIPRGVEQAYKGTRITCILNHRLTG